MRPPWVEDAALAGLLAAGLAVVDPPSAWLWYVAVFVPLVWRRSYPVPVFGAVFAVAVGTWVATGIDGVYPFVALLVALYTLVRYGSWQWAGVAVAAMAVVLATGWLQGDLPARDLVTLASAMSLAVLVGITVKTRVAYLAEHRRQAERQAELAAAAERARIAREVHDIVAHNLAVIVALADGAALSSHDTPGRAEETLTTIAGTGRQALSEMQRLLSSLHAGTRPQPGLADLDELVEQVRQAGVEATLVREGTPGEWDAGAELTVYRVVQEALTNTLKHAGPGVSAWVRVRFTLTGAEIEVTDDGHASLPRPDGLGHGLAGMAERAAAYGGSAEAGPMAEGGWRVHATIESRGGKRADTAG